MQYHTLNVHKILLLYHGKLYVNYSNVKIITISYQNLKSNLFVDRRVRINHSDSSKRILSSKL